MHPVIRTHDAGGLRATDAGTTVTLAGWVARRRDHGGVTFIDLRDASGLVQIVFREEEEAHRLRNEFCIQVAGTVQRRPAGNENPDLPTGDVEVIVTELDHHANVDPWRAVARDRGLTIRSVPMDTATGELEFCNAGHNPPYRLNGRTVEPIEGAKGIILGVRPDAVYATGRLSLAPGDCVYLFTDGVTEAADPRDELFSEQRLEAVLRAGAGVSAADIVKSVAQAVRDFVGTALPSDDITMLAVRRLDPAAA